MDKCHPHGRAGLILLLTLVFLIGANPPFAAQPHSIFPPASAHNEYLYQDEQGFIWVSSLKGWFRTDGTNFRLIGIAENDENGYDRYVQSRIYADRTGGLWYTGYNGLHRIDKSTGDLSSYRLASPGDSALVGYRAFFMDDRHQKLWLRLSDEIVIFDIGRRDFERSGLNSTDYEFTVKAFPDGSPELIIGCPWLNGPGFNIMRRKTPSDEWSNRKVLFPGAGEDHFVARAELTAGEEIILGTSEGVVSFNAADADTDPAEKWLTPRITGHPATGIIVDGFFNRLYASEKGGGVIVIDLQDDGKVNWGSSHLILQFNDPGRLNMDRNNDIWVHDLTGGIHRLNRSNPLFSKHILENAVDLRIGNNGLAYALDESGQIYSPAKKAMEIFAPSSSTKKFNGLAFSRRDWWTISPEEIRSHPLAGNGKVEILPLPEMAQKIMAVHESGDVIISGTRGVYLKYQGTKNAFFKPPAFSHTHAWDVEFLHYAPGGLLIAGYAGKEVRAYEWQADSLSLRYKININAQLLSFANGRDENSGWAGTYEGLFKITNGQAERVALDPHGLLNTQVKTIIPLGDSILFLGTESGLLVHHVQTGQTRKYTEKDGLPSHDFRAGSGGIDRHGRCWLLTGGKIISFDPDSLLAQRPDLPRAYLGGVWVNDIPLEDVPFTGREAPLNFPYWKNDLRFSVSNLGFDRPEDTRVSMRLIGRDTAWQTVAPGTPVAFSNLPPGDYRLEMESISKNGFLNRSEPVAVTITPAWYDRLYVRVLIILGLIGIGVGLNWLLVRNRIAKLEREHRRRQAISDERMRIARRLHDDLGGDLTSLMSVISTQRYLEEEGQTEQPLDLASLEEQIKEANTNMREIVWAIDDKKATFHHLAEELTKLVKRHPVRGWKPVVEFPRDLPELVFSPEQKLNVYLIFKEGVQNIVKHAPNVKFCQLKVRQETGPVPALKIELSDDGPGPFSKEADKSAKKEISGFGVENMHHRAQAIGGILTLRERSPHGTTLALLLPLHALSVPPNTR